MSGTAAVLVTGAGGMIGSAVVGTLCANGVRVRAHTGPPGYLGMPLPGGVECVAAQIGDRPAIEAACAGVDAVVHLAGPPSVAASFADPVGYARDHVLGTATVLAAAVAAGVRRLVHVSSAEVYGRSARAGVREDDELRPVSPYGAAKAAAEQLVRAAVERGEMEVVVLRPFSVYGPGSPATSLVGTIVAQSRSADEILVRSLGTVRDYVHVDDVALAAITALSRGEGGVYNIGSGRGTSVAELAQAATVAAGRAIPVRATGDPDRPAAIDLAVLVANPAAAAAALGWRARSLAAGMTAVMAALDAEPAGG